MTKFIEAVLILSGMIIGVGMFGIPFSFKEAGFLLGSFELLALGAIITVFHLLYGEIVLVTPEFHRMPGYMRIYLGVAFERVAKLSAIFGIVGTMLAYVVLGAVFLQNISGPDFEEEALAVFLVFAVAVINFFSLRKMAFINGVLTIALVVFAAFFSLTLLPRVDLGNLSGFDLSRTAIPYGVILFALAGGVVVPDVITVLGRDRKRARLAIIIGTAIPALLYFLFSTAMVGMFGEDVSKDAISGLRALDGSGLVFWGSVIGFLAVFTSFLTISESFQALLRIDMRFNRIISWLFTYFIPLLLFFLGFKNFIGIIGAVGAIAVGIDSALVIGAYHSLKKRVGMKFSPMSYLWKFLICIMILIGVIYEINNFFRVS